MKHTGKWVVAYGLLFLASTALGTLATAGAYDGVVRGFDSGIGDKQLRSVIERVYSTTSTGFGLWVLAAALFILLPPIKRALR